MTTKEVADARKTRIGKDEAWALLKTASSVSVAKGKKVLTFALAECEKGTLLQQVMGPSGNVRAPTYRVNDRFVVGFNVDLYEDWTS